MKIILTSYREGRGQAEGDEEVTEVEFIPEGDTYTTGRERFVNIRMDNKVARVKVSDLKTVVEASD